MADKDAKNGRNDAAGADVPVFASRRAGDKVATPVSDGAASEPVSGSAQSAVQADAASADTSAGYFANRTLKEAQEEPWHLCPGNIEKNWMHPLSLF